MMIFVVAGFTLLLVVFLAPSLVAKRKKAIQQVSDSFDIRTRQLKSDYQFRLKELSRRHKTQFFTDDEYHQLQQELDDETASSLESIASLKSLPVTTSSVTGLLFALIMVVAIAVVSYWYVGQPDLIDERAELLTLLEQNPKAMDYLKQQASKQGDIKAVKQLLLAARMKLDLKPLDPAVWMDFGEIQSRLGRFDQAVNAMQKAMQLDPENNNIKLALAQILPKLKTDFANREAEILVERVLRDDPDNERALLTQGFTAFSNKNYALAIAAWEKVLEKRAPGSKAVKLLERSIQTAKMKMAAGNNGSKQSKNTSLNSSQGVKVVVKISPEVRQSLTGNETLFVFAKAASGPPMPLAAVRFPLKAIPKEIVLNDKNAMRPALKMSQYKDIYVSARISKTGTAIAQKGDITVKSEPVTAPFSGQTIHINFIKSR